MGTIAVAAAIVFVSLVQLVILASGLAFVWYMTKRSSGRNKVQFTYRFTLRGGFEIHLEVNPAGPETD